VHCIFTKVQLFSENTASVGILRRRMKFRLKAFGLHLLGSACLLALALGGLYLGWYRWPGWYLAGALTIALMMAGIDVVLGPLLTLLIASPRKPRRELARDISIIVAVQLLAASYGIMTLWNGRPLYYTYSAGWLQMVQAQDLNPEQVVLGRKLNPGLAPHWYSLPRWIYAPLPKDAKLAQEIVVQSVGGGDDVVNMPPYYKPWSEGLPDIRRNLQTLDKLKGLFKRDRQAAAGRMRKMGLAPDQPVMLPMIGKGKPLVAVLDPATVTIEALVRVD
jgi:hypothetical protein